MIVDWRNIDERIIEEIKERNLNKRLFIWFHPFSFVSPDTRYSTRIKEEVLAVLRGKYLIEHGKYPAFVGLQREDAKTILSQLKTFKIPPNKLVATFLTADGFSIPAYEDTEKTKRLEKRIMTSIDLPKKTSMNQLLEEQDALFEEFTEMLTGHFVNPSIDLGGCEIGYRTFEHVLLAQGAGNPTAF